MIWMPWHDRSSDKSGESAIELSVTGGCQDRTVMGKHGAARAFPLFHFAHFREFNE
jgi:hypothetical protein